MNPRISTRARIIAAASVIALAGIATTVAQFSDSGQLSTSLESGTLDLKFDNNQDGVESAYKVNFSTGSDNLKPGDEVTMSVVVFNSGSVPAMLAMTAPTISNSAGTPETPLQDSISMTITAGGEQKYNGTLTAANLTGLNIGADGSQAEGTTLTFTAKMSESATTAVAGQKLNITLDFTATPV